MNIYLKKLEGKIKSLKKDTDGGWEDSKMCIGKYKNKSGELCELQLIMTKDELVGDNRHICVTELDS